jgi:hypothetical protein
MLHAYLQLDGYAGRTQQRVIELSRSARKVRIQAITRTRLGGRRRYLEAGEIGRVPLHAITAQPILGVALVGEPIT